jgi:hypothetical protein
MMFDEFEFEALEDEEFKEDSVREVLVAPIVERLGYSLIGDNRVVRSRSLLHPYVAIGSKQRKISIVPDYLFLSDGKPFWVLDAKAPTEEILKSTHVEQAYSYAIHPDVRAELFALCNGYSFALFSVRQFEPLLVFELKDIEAIWDKLFRILNPLIKADPETIQYHPDFGLHLRRLSVEPGFKIIIMAANSSIIGKVRDGRYTSTTAFPSGGRDYAVSLDFSEPQLDELFSVLPIDQVELLTQGLTAQPYMAMLENEDFQFGVVAELSQEILHNPEESYAPFVVIEFLKYNDSFEYSDGS